MKSSIIDRPSRFDKKYNIDLPNLKMCIKYLKHMFKGMITDVKLNDVAKVAFSNKLSYAYLRELYISSMFEAISHNRKKPINADVDAALKILLRDKSASSTKIDLNSYF